jgi:hypothetical protein
VNRELVAEWDKLKAPAVAGELDGVQAPNCTFEDARLAVDHAGRWHLLISAAHDDDALAVAPIQGLDFELDTLRIGEHPPTRYFDLACRDDSLRSNFAVLADDILSELEHNRNARQVIGTVLRRWRRFWKNRPGELSSEDITGLFGELWFLDSWMGPPTLRTVEAWFGPSEDRHDFRARGVAVEVKATRTRSEGAPKHRISRLDQLLAPDGAELFMFSLRVVPDPLAALSLQALINRLRQRMQDEPDAVSAFDERLAAAGLAPGDAERYDDRLRVVDERLYRVDAAFPKLTPGSFYDGLPNGVEDVTYSLDLAACERWLVARAPGPASEKLRAQFADDPSTH